MRFLRVIFTAAHRESLIDRHPSARYLVILNVAKNLVAQYT